MVDNGNEFKFLTTYSYVTFSYTLPEIMKAVKKL